MLIELFKNEGNPKQLEKTLHKIGEITGNFKDPTSLESPTFLIPLRSLNFNYVKISIQNLDYFYFVEGVNFIHGKIELNCHIDVLQTFQEDIKNLSGDVERTSNFNYQNYKIEDSDAVTTSDTKIKVKKLGSLYSISGGHYYLTTTN